MDQGLNAEPGTFFKNKDSTWQIQQATRKQVLHVYIDLFKIQFLRTSNLRKGDVVISTKLNIQEFHILPFGIISI